MFSLLNISDKILLDPGELNPIKQEDLEYKPNILALESDDQQKKKEKNIPKYLEYSDVVYKKLRKKYISKILMGIGLVISIQKFNIKSNLIIEIEGYLNVEVNLRKFNLFLV